MAARQPRTEWVQVPHGPKLRVLHWPGRGRPMVLVHGFLDSAEGWNTYCEISHRPCYALDLPGFGSSEPPTGPGLERYAGAVVRMMEHYDLDDVCLVGHSLGGAVASQVVEMAPERVLSLALLAPAGFGPLPLAEWANRPLPRRLLSVATPVALAAPLLASAVYASEVSGGVSAPRELQSRLVRQALRGPRGPHLALRTLAELSATIRERGLLPRSYRGPVSVLWGTRDRLVPVQQADAVKLVLPQAHLDVWPGLAHHPQVERPQQLADWLDRAAIRARNEHRKRHRSRPRPE